MLVGSEDERVDRAKRMLEARFKIKDLGEVSTYLGMQVTRNRSEGWLELSLQKYATGLADKLSDVLQGSSRVQTPMAPDVLHKIRAGGWPAAEAQKVSRELYLSIIGSLMYAATAARPDLAFTVSTLAQASADPRAIHLGAAVRALRYFVDTADLALHYSRDGETEIVGYTDSDWGNEPDGKSRAAYVFKLAGGAVSWSSRKLDGIADSTTVAEYKALSFGAKEAIWLRQLMGELRQSTQAITLCCDNQSAIKLSHNTVMHQRTKHVKLAWHLVRHAVKDGDVVVKFVRTCAQDADMLTKALDGPKHKDNRQRIGLLPKTGTRTGLSAFLEGELRG